MKNYPGKLLLFGEHTVNVGSQALAVPLPLFSGKWAFAPKGQAMQLDPAELAARQMQLPAFSDYLDRLQHRGELLANLDVAAFRHSLHEGLVFESNIPTGYGAGSSGALVAAVFENWQSAVGSREYDMAQLRKALAQMEGFFHGTSSGTDPLICFLQKPVLLGEPEGVRIVELPSNNQSPVTNHQLFLLDTGKERQAAEFIEYFLKKMRGKTFEWRCKMGLIPAVDSAIASFLSGDVERLFEQMHYIGEFQLRFLVNLVPKKLRPVWQAGLDGDLYKLKVCGAGGGGFLLGITKDFKATKAALARWKLLPVMAI